MSTTYQIVRLSPAYCQITDSIIGTNSHPLPMSYHSEALAHKLAGRMHEDAYEGCSDDGFVVVEYGKSPFSHRLYPSAPVASDDIPF